MGDGEMEEATAAQVINLEEADVVAEAAMVAEVAVVDGATVAAAVAIAAKDQTLVIKVVDVMDEPLTPFQQKRWNLRERTKSS